MLLCNKNVILRAGPTRQKNLLMLLLASLVARNRGQDCHAVSKCLQVNCYSGYLWTWHQLYRLALHPAVFSLFKVASPQAFLQDIWQINVLVSCLKLGILHCSAFCPFLVLMSMNTVGFCVCTWSQFAQLIKRLFKSNCPGTLCTCICKKYPSAWWMMLFNVFHVCRKQTKGTLLGILQVN